LLNESTVHLAATVVVEFLHARPRLERFDSESIKPTPTANDVTLIAKLNELIAALQA
jgi:hypothetical protein